MVILLFFISALLSNSYCTASNNSKVDLPDDLNDGWEALYKIIQSNTGGRSELPLSAFDRIIVANAQARGLERSDKDNFLFQGDIAMDQKEVVQVLSGEKRRKRAAIKKNSQRLWKRNIRYVLSSNLDGKAVKVISEAIKEWEKTLPCLGRWRRIGKNDRIPSSYIRFIKGKGCYSKVGRVGGRQEISVGENCEYRGVVVHEIGHAMGFWHEHSRVDRDKFVKIKWENILPEMKYNFEKFSSSKLNDLGVTYDYESIMHYGPKAFSKDGKLSTISVLKSKKKKIRLGQRDALSKKDKEQAQRLYGCKINLSSCISSPCLNGGTCSDKGDTFQCKCPSSHIGRECEQKLSDCKDYHRKNCKGWASAGYCYDTEYKSFMFQKCCQSCFALKKGNACNSSPCLNGGVCTQQGNRFQCKCPSSYNGRRCERNYNPCDSSPCLNGGVCSQQGNKFQCKCSSSYMGQRCERTYNPCDSSPCLNGGRCSNKGTTFTCRCPSTYTGKRCEQKGTKCIRDLHKGCRYWTKYCSPGNKYYKFMTKNCCQTCKVTSSSGCTDKVSTRQCSKWKESGFCNVRRYESYLAKNCAKTCGIC